MSKIIYFIKRDLIEWEGDDASDSPYLAKYLDCRINRIMQSHCNKSVETFMVKISLIKLIRHFDGYFFNEITQEFMSKKEAIQYADSL